MYGATVDSTSDSTFGFITARAARYPAIVKNDRIRTIMRRSTCKPVDGDPGIRWLLLNTQMTNRLLMGTG